MEHISGHISIEMSQHGDPPPHSPLQLPSMALPPAPPALPPTPVPTTHETRTNPYEGVLDLSQPSSKRSKPPQQQRMQMFTTKMTISKGVAPDTDTPLTPECENAQYVEEGKDVSGNGIPASMMMKWRKKRGPTVGNKIPFVGVIRKTPSRADIARGSSTESGANGEAKSGGEEEGVVSNEAETTGALSTSIFAAQGNDDGDPAGAGSPEPKGSLTWHQYVGPADGPSREDPGVLSGVKRMKWSQKVYRTKEEEAAQKSSMEEEDSEKGKKKEEGSPRRSVKKSRGSLNRLGGKGRENGEEKEADVSWKEFPSTADNAWYGSSVQSLRIGSAEPAKDTPVAAAEQNQSEAAPPFRSASPAETPAEEPPSTGKRKRAAAQPTSRLPKTRKKSTTVDPSPPPPLPPPAPTRTSTRIRRSGRLSLNGHNPPTNGDRPKLTKAEKELFLKRITQLSSIEVEYLHKKLVETLNSSKSGEIEKEIRLELDNLYPVLWDLYDYVMQCEVDELE
ncbi:hypothetical protein BJ742DRAFT_202294 [Cladochytrium replicatum]|nr:hypothetical protein BJ742DRAFT_202294 [Cladochytrium replicatum]